MEAEWILCPLCGGKTRDKIREDTVLVNYRSGRISFAKRQRDMVCRCLVE